MCRTPPLNHSSHPPDTTTTTTSTTNPHVINTNTSLNLSNITTNHDYHTHNHVFKAPNYDFKRDCSLSSGLSTPATKTFPNSPDLLMKGANQVEYSAVSMEEEDDDIEIAIPKTKFHIYDQALHCPSLHEVGEELGKLMGNAIPLVIAGLMLYPRGMISMYFLGRMGELELAGGALSIAFANITGYSVLYGLALGMEPICGQAFGAHQHDLMIRTMRMAMVGLALASLPIACLWWTMGSILMSCGQDPEVTSMASIYITYSLPDLLVQCLLHPLRIYLRSQNITLPLSYCAALALPLHVLANVLAVDVFHLGVRGVALASVSTNVNMFLLLLAYLKLFSKRPISIFMGSISDSSAQYCNYTNRDQSRGGTANAQCGTTNVQCPSSDSSGSFRSSIVGFLTTTRTQDWLPLVKLAIPSCVSVCLEWWWYELMIILSGLLVNAKATVATMGILIQITALVYIFPSSLSLAVSTRVSNELGANRPGKARLAVMVASCCAIVLGVLSMAFTTTIRHSWGLMFTHDETILRLTSMALPIIGLCELGNSPQTTGCGVLRGSARPSVGVKINLAAFYIVGLPVSIILVFWLNVGFVGLWLGLLAAQATCAVSMMLVMVRTNWLLEADRSRELTKKAIEPTTASTTRLDNAGEMNDAKLAYQPMKNVVDEHEEEEEEETLSLFISHSHQ